jgi:hypothetical protein
MPPKAPPAPPTAAELKRRVPTPAEQLAALPPPGTPLNMPLTSGPTGSPQNIAATPAAPPKPLHPQRQQLLDIAKALQRIGNEIPTPNVMNSRENGAELIALADILRKMANG